MSSANLTRAHRSLKATSLRLCYPHRNKPCSITMHLLHAKAHARRAMEAITRELFDLEPISPLPPRIRNKRLTTRHRQF